MKKLLYIFLPLIIALSIAAGIYIGYTLTFNALRGQAKNINYNKLDYLLDIIEREYVDSISQSDIIEKSIPHIMSELDPHSKYIPAKDLEKVNNELKTSFDGIGVAFQLLNDSLIVTEVIEGGPASFANIKKFDRIVQINDTTYVGKDLNRELVVNKLRGPKETQVKVGVKRKGTDDLIPITITRGSIPDKSIPVSYKTGDNIGYIQITRFANTTYQEFLLAIAKLKSLNCTGFIIDLRNNLGGYMEPAINIANEFLPEGRLIVYTEGKAMPRSNSFANGSGSCQKDPVIILINGESASASEILAGAIQDNDRGLIIGQRSFGKGLVQQQPAFYDGSALRLTIARYYTPSGRCIQKPYQPGKEEEYLEETWQRYTNGEAFSADSIKFNDSLRYETVGGRTVYGGGGIMPDKFVPIDTSFVNSYFISIRRKMLIENFALQYAETHYDTLSTHTHYWSLLQYLNEEDLLEKFIVYADRTGGVRRRPYAIDKSGKKIESMIKGQIANIVIGQEAYLPIFFQTDPTYWKAIQEMKERKDPLLQTDHAAPLQNTEPYNQLSML